MSRVKSFRIPGALLALALTLGACNSTEPGGPSQGSESGLEVEVLSGDHFTGIYGSSHTTSIRVRHGGRPATSTLVEFRVISGGGTVVDSLVRVDSDGVASNAWLLGVANGPQVLRATVGGKRIEFTATASPPVPGKTYFGRNNYVEFVPGELPIILSSPHDGGLTPSEIPTRTSGTTARDLDTGDLTRKIAAELEKLTGKRPHMAVMHLRRTKIDANRTLEVGTEDNHFVHRAWYEYHLWLDVARTMIARDHGRGILFDIHGHGHEIQRLELGYMLRSADLNRPDHELDSVLTISKSSIRRLGTESPLPFSELVRGEDSLGEILIRNGYPAIPSKSDPMPGADPFLSHGYTLERHGTSSGSGAVDAIMIEHNRQNVRDTEANRAAYAKAVARSMVEFINKHLGYNYNY